MPLLDGRGHPFEDPELELVLLRARAAGARTEARRRLAAFAPTAVLVATFAISCLALVVGVP
ncbi:hypothetical protein [Sinomonas terrae]|uniref:Uncharacterized protein n=1 Tax=Sinomonas terrae TaxID=2908838 RepID=A0ABS9U3D7_9MICC|nr:hypothetical protein [Sinomonas terrae]MCH6471017.1 hypothetical protein [Sinomonas terrae]